jgi:hypothetical protein
MNKSQISEDIMRSYLESIKRLADEREALYASARIVEEERELLLAVYEYSHTLDDITEINEASYMLYCEQFAQSM